MFHIAIFFYYDNKTVTKIKFYGRI